MAFHEQPLADRSAAGQLMQSAGTFSDPAQPSAGTRILASLKGHIQPIRTPPLYFAGLVLVTVGMLI